MRRMMTCRSSLALVALGLALITGRAEAQDTQGRTHVVQTGETLWTLAERYMGDALMWPAIYRLNTMVVEDPHWIYPGEELQLGAGVEIAAEVEPVAAQPGDTGAAERVAAAPGDTVAAQPMAGPPLAADSAPAVEQPSVAAGELPPPPPPPGEGAPTVFARQAPRAPTFTGRATSTSRGVLPGQFYGSGFLTEDDKLPWAEVIGASGKATLGSLTNITSARIFESIELKAPEGSSYHIGDSLLIAALGREVPRWGEVVMPTGIARVREVSGRRVVADILSQWSRVGSNQVAMPLEPFRNQGTGGPAPIENGLMGSIIVSRDLHQLPADQAVIFIDKGRNDGVSLGDVFEVLKPNPPGASAETPLQQVAVLQIVHVRQRSASGVVTHVGDLGLRPGAPVRLIRKMPS